MNIEIGWRLMGTIIFLGFLYLSVESARRASKK